MKQTRSDTLNGWIADCPDERVEALRLEARPNRVESDSARQRLTYFDRSLNSRLFPPPCLISAVSVEFELYCAGINSLPILVSGQRGLASQSNPSWVSAALDVNRPR